MKNKQRQFFQHQRKSLSLLQKKQASLLFEAQLKKLPFSLASKKVGLYAPHQHELNILAIQKHAFESFFPKVSLQKMLTYGRTLDEPGPFGILQPHDAPISPKDLDIIFVPGIAFSPKGERLGSGHGYFDRTLAHINVLKIGCCFQITCTNQLIQEKHDILMDWVITEECIYECSIFR